MPRVFPGVKSTSYDLSLVKWIVLPGIFLVCVSAGILKFSGERACRELAAERGFVDSRYRVRALDGKHCVCIGKILPDGRVDMRVERRLFLDETTPPDRDIQFPRGVAE